MSVTKSTVDVEMIDTSFLASFKEVIDDESDVIVEHRHYRGSKSPTRIVFQNYDQLVEYVDQQVKYGDTLYVWKFNEVCTDDTVGRSAIRPDANGTVPERGSY